MGKEKLLGLKEQGDTGEVEKTKMIGGISAKQKEMVGGSVKKYWGEVEASFAEKEPKKLAAALINARALACRENFQIKISHTNNKTTRKKREVL